jgi:hypothetical protein
MDTVTFLDKASLIVTIAVNVIVLALSFPAYRRTKMSAFGFLILSSTTTILLLLAQMSYHPQSDNRASELRTFWTLYFAFGIVSVISYGIGVCQLIRFVKAKLKKEREDNA